jgi:hypothetical protein
MSHYFYVMILGFGLTTNVTTVAAMEKKEESGPIPMSMENRVDGPTLRDRYSFDELIEMLKALDKKNGSSLAKLMTHPSDKLFDKLKEQPIRALRAFGNALLISIEKENDPIDNCACIKGSCCPGIPALKRLEIALRNNSEELYWLINTNTPEEILEKKALIATRICTIAETYAQIIKIRGEISGSICLGVGLGSLVFCKFYGEEALDLVLNLLMGMACK